MTEVLRDNFEDNFPKIEKDIRDASFVAIDTEFSGLLSSNDFKSSLFDSPEERYVKQRANISEVLLLQFGFTAFIYDREKNTYRTKTYCAYLFPHTFGSIDLRFKCQASSLEFLCHNQFDFNKFVYNGVSFMNDEQDIQAQHELNDGHLIRSVERALSYEDENSVQALCSQVALWLAGGEPAEDASQKSMLLEIPKSSQSSQCIAYVIHHELRRRFVSIWTVPEEGKIRVMRVSAPERALMAKNLTHETELQGAVLQSLRGFTRVFRLLVDLKKPIIAHNCSLDLLLMYKQFYQSLPKSYQTFKKNIHKLFPLIYDTKFISSEFKMKVPRADCWTSNTLPALYNYFATGKGLRMVPYSPKIFSEDYDADCKSKFHDAGWDSYCAGVCYARMAHFYGALEMGQISLARTFTSTEHLAFTAHLANRVNIIRGNLSHYVLDGVDPPSRRPNVIVIKRRDGGRLNVNEITESLSKHGSVDVKLVTDKVALVAASTQGMMKDICLEYFKHPELAVVKYDSLHHNPFIRTATWSALILLFISSGFLFARALKR